MYRSSSGRSGPSSSSSSHRLKEGSSSGSRASRSSTSGPGPGRGRPPPPPPPAAAAASSSSSSAAASASPPRSASPRPPPRRHRSPSGHRGASRRSPSPHRSRRLPSPPGGPGPGGTRGRRGSEHGDGSSSRRRSPSLRSESSLEQSLRITVGNDRYCIGTPERRRLPDRLGSPIDNLSDRDDMADGPIFTRGLSCPRGLERYPSHEDQSSSPFIIRHDEDYRNRDVFLHRSDYSPHYGRREELPRGSDRDGDKLRKSSYPSRPEERGREIKRPRYEKDEKMHGVSGEHQSFSSGTRNYRRRSRSRSRSPSPSYLNEEFRELDRARRKREEEERSRNLNHDVSGSGYVIPGLTNTLQTSEPRYTYRPEEIPSMPKKSILKKRVEVEVESPIQPEGFSSSLAPSKDLPLLSSHSALPQSNDTAPFASEVENFLKRFSKASVVESANKELHDGLYEWSSLSGAPKDAFTFEEKFGSFLSHKEKVEPKSEPADRHTDFLLPHERASQDGSGFSRILGMMADSVSAQEKRRRSFPDIEDEEKFLYGDEDEDTKTESLPVQKPPASCGNDIIGQKMSPPPSPTSAVKLDPLEDSNAEYAKIHDLLKTIGLDIGVAEIGKLAVRTQERLHGKKLASRSPDRRSSDPRRLDPWDLRRSRSDTRSPESGQQRSASPPVSFQQSKDASALQKSEYIKNKPIGQDIPPCAPEQPLPSVSLIPSVPPAPASLPPTPSSVSQYQIPNYSQFTATQMPQNYPPPTMAPPGYDAYGHYMAYAAPGWTMYPPAQQPNPTLPEAHGLLTMAMSANPTRPNLRVIETVSMGKDVPDLKRDGSVLVHVPTTPAHSKVPLRLSSHPLKNTTEKMSDEKNRAAQKQKVIEEREKLKNEREARQKKLYYLKTELDRLRKQQGEMLRKKRREKDGHKDPLLVEVNRLQENIMKEISELHKESDAADKKQSELDKVAQILGINIFEKPRKPSVETKDSSEKNSKSENAKGLEKTSSNKESKATNEKSRGRSPKPAESSSQSSKHPFQLANIYEYYDAGNHWCKDCNTICGTMFDFFTHMHNKKHRQTLDPYNRPWASKTQSETKQDSIKRIDKITVPAKGSEFLIPITGYYCQLCHEFFGDQISAEQHVKSHPHNEKYKKYIDENPLYEERRNLDRQAGLAVVLETERRRQSELKRKLVEKQKEEKDEKKPKIIKKEEAKSIPELGEGTSETQGKIDSAGRKMGIKLKLKKEEKEEKKEEKKEETKKESPSQTSFGKFSWKKTEREDKTPGGAIPKEESTEGNKEENKCQPGKPHVKPIEIKLSGKTVIPHTSPWTPVVSTSTPAKILPNLPVPTMIFRKSTTATVSKPAPLNTFLSIKSSGATTKPLPVVKETNADLLLPPDIISKAFGGEEVILKGAEEELKATEKSESSQTSDIPPPPPPPPAVQPAAVIPADEVAPGVSESEQTMLAMPVRPPPPPRPSTAFSEQAKKVEKRNSCLATANAKDLYDIFYSSGGKGSADSKLASSALANGENSNLIKPADLSPNPRTNNSSSSLKEDSQNMATDVSQVHSAERSLELEKTDIQETSVLHTDISPDIENGIRKDVGQKFQAPLSTDVRTKLKEDSSQCNNQVMGSWVLGENQAAMNKKPLQPQLPEMSVTELPETKTASGIQMPAEIGLVDIGGREQVGSQEFCNLQKAEIQEKVGQEDANKTAVTNTNVPGTLEKDAEMKDWKVKTVNPELSLHPKTLLPETQNEIQNLGNSHLVEGKLSDNCRTHSEADSPNLVCESQNTSKGKALVAVMTEQSSIDASLKDVKLKSVALEISQPGVLGKAPRTLETQNKISELTRSPGEWATSRTSNGEEQVITARSCSERGWDLSGTPNVEIKAGSNEVSSSELVEIQPDACLANTQTRSSTLEAQEKVRPEPSGHTVLDNQTQRQEVAWLVNACSANIVEVRSSVELVVEVGKKSLGHTGSDATLDNVFVKRDAKEVGTGGFSRARSDIFQESVVALSANFCREHLSEEAVHPPETKHEVVRTSAANDFHLNTVHSGLNSEQSKNFSANVRVDNKKVSLTSEDAKHNEIPSQKAELEFKSTDFSLGDTKVKHECFSILTAGLLNENMEDVSKLETVASIRLESSKLRKLSIEKTVDEREITDFAALTSGSQEDKFCTRISQTAVPQLGLQSSNSDTTEVVMPVLEMQDISPVSEILLQVEESKGGAVEMPSLSCDGGSTESQASGCVETFLPGPKEASGKEGGSGGKGVCIIQSKKTEQTETADSSLEATTNSGIAESLAESPVG